MADNVFPFPGAKANREGNGSGKNSLEQEEVKKRKLEGEIRNLMGEATNQGVPTKPRRRSTGGQKIEGCDNIQATDAKTAHQTIRGSRNIQVSGGSKVTVYQGDQKVTRRITPPSGTIGANAGLKRRIQMLAHEIQESRHKRLGEKMDFKRFYPDLARNIGTKKWTDIWLWDEQRAPEVIGILEDLLDRTIDGRIKKAARRRGYQHTRGHLFGLEKQYSEQLGWTKEETRREMRLLTGHDSHADLTDSEFKNFVLYLRRLAENRFGETDN